MENTARAEQRDSEPIELSVVIPMHDEEGALEELHGRLMTTLIGVTASFEIAYVDDALEWVLSLNRNFGHQAAIAAGLDHAAGCAVVTMDADLQDPPELIPSLVARWRSGEDVVLSLPEHQKYLRGLVSWAEFRHGVAPYHRQGRSSGRSTFTYRIESCRA